MGYRSDVKIVFYLTHGTSDSIDEFNAKRGTTTLPFAALKLWFDENYPVQMAKDEWCATIDYEDSGDNYIMVSYQDVKWYPSYQHMQDVEAIFEKFSDVFRSDERDHRGQYEFLRIGEEDADIEGDRSSYADHRLSVERSIIFE